MNGIQLSIRPASLGGRGHSRSDPLRRLLHRALRSIVQGYRRGRQRRALAQLDQRLLRDIGVTAAQAGLESGKPFWRE